MIAEFNWWLLIVGLVIGAGLVYLVLADASRRDEEIDDGELPAEAAWIAAALEADGVPLAPETAERVLRLHREYLAGPPPDAEDLDLEREGHQPASDDSGSALRDDPHVQGDGTEPEATGRHGLEARGLHPGSERVGVRESVE